MDIFTTFASNKKLEEEGKEIEIGKDVFITVARSGNAAYNRLFTKLLEAHKHELEQKGPEAEYRSEQILLEVNSKTILLGWRTVKDGVSKPELMFKGESLAYTQANARKVLELKDFRNMVAKHSDNFQNYREVSDEADVKKSQPTSSGT